ncbi:MAG: hypothetical protein ACRDV3_12235 [Acidothermaceae bacterium]
MSEPLPAPDPHRFPKLQSRHLRVIETGTLLGRIHPQSGAHPSLWNEFRRFGPTRSRFDHQPPPAREHPQRAIFYAVPAMNDRRGKPVPVLRTCIAECFRDRGVAELRRDDPYFVLFRTIRPLRLLDLVDSDWVALAGGNGAISTGTRSTAREWSRAIYRHYTGEQAIDGLFYLCANVPVARTAAIFERGRRAVPPRPEAHLPLSHPSLRAELEIYATHLGLDLLP